MAPFARYGTVSNNRFGTSKSKHRQTHTPFHGTKTAQHIVRVFERKRRVCLAFPRVSWNAQLASVCLTYHRHVWERMNRRGKILVIRETTTNAHFFRALFQPCFSVNHWCNSKLIPGFVFLMLFGRIFDVAFQNYYMSV